MGAAVHKAGLGGHDGGVAKHDGTGRDPNPDEVRARFEEMVAGLNRDELRDLADAMLAEVNDLPEPVSRRRPRRSEPVTLQVRVTLDGTDVWRRIEVANDIPLDELHVALQLVMGWEDVHLHQFVDGTPFDRDSERFLTAADVAEGERGTLETDVHLDELLHEVGDVLAYVYDFGDGWEHTLRLEAVRPRTDDAPRVRCTAGERACPPEDCGGVPGYLDIVEEAAREPDAATRAATVEALARFDVDEVNRMLTVTERHAPPRTASVGSRSVGSDPVRADPVGQVLGRAHGPGARVLLDLVGRADLGSPVEVVPDTAARMVGPFGWFVRHVGLPGRDLTGAGYLRPADVRALAEVLGLVGQWPGTLNRENQTYPVWAFRQASRDLGLVRVARGRIMATRAGMKLADDPVAMWWHIAGRLPLGTKQHVRDAAIITLLMTAAGNQHAERGVDVMEALGWMRPDGAPLTPGDVDRQASQTREVLVWTGALVPARRFAEPVRTTPEGVLFARAALQRWG